MKKLFVISSVLLLFSCNSNKSSETSESVAMDSTKMNSDSINTSSLPTTDTISTNLQNDSMSVKTDSVNKR